MEIPIANGRDPGRGSGLQEGKGPREGTRGRREVATARGKGTSGEPEVLQDQLDVWLCDNNVTLLSHLHEEALGNNL